MILNINKNLSLSELLNEDIQNLHKILNKNSIVEFLPINKQNNIGDTQAFYKEIKKSNNIIWKINYTLKNEKHMIGIIDLTNINKSIANLAYIIDPNFSGKGIATLVVDKVTNYAFNKLGIIEVIAPVVSQNIRSQKVLLKNEYKNIKNINRSVNFDGELDHVLLYIKNKPIEI